MNVLRFPGWRCLAIAVWNLLVAGLGIGQDRTIEFARDIRPILNQACVHCHGPDDDARQADLRLDTREGLYQELGERSVVIPGDVAASELWLRIHSSEDDVRMPPPESNKQLNSDQRELLRKWIEQGATWQQHWAFVAPTQPEVPLVSDLSHCRNELDLFLQARLSELGLSLSETAQPHKLVRRLYLDLIGLPPSPDEADAWVRKIWPGYEWGNQDGSTAAGREVALDEAAYQSLVSRLLNSPHYGQRWARKWLDLARYADTNGYEKDRERTIWPYRDWVVDALNSDLSFDRFTVEQLAGDMLPNATLEQRIATGFHRNTMLNEEGGIDPLEFRFHAMTDRVATTGTVWLGLTLGCCQCHTHKYDPISHSEYYQLMGLLNNADEPFLELPDEQSRLKWQQNQLQASKLLEDLPSKWPAPQLNSPAANASKDPSHIAVETRRSEAMETALRDWIEQESKNAVHWENLQPLRATSNLPTLTILSDASILASGDTAKRDDYEVTFEPHDQTIAAIRLEALPDDSLPAGGPGSTYYEGTLGDFYLTEIHARVRDRSVPFRSASETFAQNRYGKNPVSAALAIDGDIQTGWSVHGRQAERHVAVFVLQEPLPPGSELLIHMSFGRHFASSLGRFRVSACSEETLPQARGYSAETATLIRRVAESATFQLSDLTEQQRLALFQEFLLAAPELSSEAEKIRQLLIRPEFATTLVMSERPADQPRKTFRHERGEYLRPVEEVQPGVPAVLPALPVTAAPNRLAFARWLVSPENPLTARVVVNRHWAAFFGTGLVKTLDDLGVQGEPPSHPELLDWLSIQFMLTDHWSVKALHRRIVSSHAYRQSSIVDARALQMDPDNRLLSYFPRVRLDAEVLRDSLLQASGVLAEISGGPPVRPPQPAGVTEVAYGSPGWDSSQGADRYRRSIYTFIKRTAPFSMYATFDAPSGEACIAKRSRTNSPLQALTLLNDAMILELAQAVAKQICPPSMQSMSKASVRSSAMALFRRVLIRLPTDNEVEQLQRFFELQFERFSEAPELARQFAGIRQPEMAQSQWTNVQAAELAAWTATARAIFALDETQSRE
ncbi:MAG: PSD1 domain-containing protein [Planctomycetales bacterium]|nr:PSD1 domain-containing protein [Planctomycetales bacterium]